MVSYFQEHRLQELEHKQLRKIWI